MDEVLKKLKEHDKKFAEHDKYFEKIDKKFAEHDKRFDQIDTQIDFLVTKVLEHDERLERIETNMATKSDIGQITTTLDKLVHLYEKRDQELVATAHNHRRLSDRVDNLEKDMKQVKPALGLA